jgi:metal-responsive CopG/Arc/MetJ family transcriptional regulator
MQGLNVKLGVIMLSQAEEEDKWATVRIPVELLEALDRLVKEEKDEFGMPKYRSKSEAVAEAVKQFLKKHKGASNVKK